MTNIISGLNLAEFKDLSTLQQFYISRKAEKLAAKYQSIKILSIIIWSRRKKRRKTEEKMDKDKKKKKREKANKKKHRWLKHCWEFEWATELIKIFHH